MIGQAESYINKKYSDPQTPHNNLLRNLPNPRHPERPGVRMVCAATPLGNKPGINNPKEALQEIRKQLDKNIENELLFDAGPIGINEQILNNDFTPAITQFQSSLVNLGDVVGESADPVPKHAQKLAKSRARATLNAHRIP